MSLREQIQKQQIEAMKKGETDTVSTLRMLIAAIKNEEIDKQTKPLGDEGVQAVISRQVKQLRDAERDYEAGKRQDLVEKTQKEIAVLSLYLPTQMDDAELTGIVSRVVKETGASNAADLGRVMGLVMKEVKGRADGNRVRQFVAQTLGS